MMRFEIEHGGGSLVFDRDQGVVVNGEQRIRLTERQSMLLQMLCTMPDHCVSRADYAQLLSGREWDPRQRLPLDQHVHGLRQAGVPISSRRGIGYVLRGQVRQVGGGSTQSSQLQAANSNARGPAMAQFWIDDRGRWVPALPDHLGRAQELVGLPDAGASAYLLKRPGFVQLCLGDGWLRACFDESAVSPAAIAAIHDFLSTQGGYDKLSFETVSQEAKEFENTLAAIAWLERTQGLADRIMPGCVIEEAMDAEACDVPEIRDLLKAWHGRERAEFYADIQTKIRHAGEDREAMAPIHRVLCVEPDREGEPVYTEVGPGILMYGTDTALYLRGLRVCDQAAPGYAQRAADHYRRALNSDRPILARIRSTVRLEDGVRTLAHLRLSLPASSGGKRAVVARTVNV